MRPLGMLLALALAALPAALLAQDAPVSVPIKQPARPTYIRPPYTPRPVRPTPPGHRPPGYRPGSNNRYPIVIVAPPDAYATPYAAPTKKPATTKPPKMKNGQDTFETHSSTDANE
jgi:hypothetical protein